MSVFFFSVKTEFQRVVSQCGKCRCAGIGPWGFQLSLFLSISNASAWGVVLCAALRLLRINIGHCFATPTREFVTSKLFFMYKTVVTHDSLGSWSTVSLKITKSFKINWNLKNREVIRHYSKFLYLFCKGCQNFSWPTS